jgi:hypothetical protein
VGEFSHYLFNQDYLHGQVNPSLEKNFAGHKFFAALAANFAETVFGVSGLTGQRHTGPALIPVKIDAAGLL